MNNFRIVPVSGNKKTGPIVVTSTNSNSCPDTCPHIERGCYGKGGNSRIHWDKLDQANESIKNVAVGVIDACKLIEKLPPRSIVRHNEVGDLPHNKGKIIKKDWLLLDKSLNSYHKKPFTYTHHLLTSHNIDVIKQSKTTINISCETPEGIREAKDQGLDTVITVKNLKKVEFIQGHKIVQCPAEYSSIKCSSCGNGTPLCQRKNRNYTIGFNAHGNGKNKLKVLTF